MLYIQTEKDYQAVVEEFSDMIYRTAYQNLMNTADAEDVVQDVFIRLLRHRKKRFADKEHLRAWLLRVTINRSRDYRRFVLRRKETEIPESLETHTETESLLEEIEELPEEDRTIVYLHYYEGYSIKEIAKIMGKNSNTVSSKLTRARKKLKTMLDMSGFL